MTNSAVPKLRGVRLLPGLMAISLVCMLLAAALLLLRAPKDRVRSGFAGRRAASRYCRRACH